MVGMLDALSLKNTKLGLETLELMGYDRERIRARAQPRRQPRSGSRHDDVVAIVGRAPDVLVPSDREVTRSVNEGKPIVLAQPQLGGGACVPRARRALPAGPRSPSGSAPEPSPSATSPALLRRKEV